jgi:hypothetical protein
MFIIPQRTWANLLSFSVDLIHILNECYFHIAYLLSSGVAQSVQCLTTDWTTGRSRFDSGRGKGFFLQPLCPDWLWGPPSLLYNGTGGSFPGAKRGRSVTLTTHPHPVPRSGMSRSYPSLPPSACVACSGIALLFATYYHARGHGVGTEVIFVTRYSKTIYIFLSCFMERHTQHIIKPLALQRYTECIYKYTYQNKTVLPHWLLFTSHYLQNLH